MQTPLCIHYPSFVNAKQQNNLRPIHSKHHTTPTNKNKASRQHGILCNASVSLLIGLCEHSLPFQEHPSNALDQLECGKQPSNTSPSAPINHPAVRCFGHHYSPFSVVIQMPCKHPRTKSSQGLAILVHEDCPVSISVHAMCPCSRQPCMLRRYNVAQLTVGLSCICAYHCRS